MGKVEGSSMYQKWYFEVTVDHLEQVSHHLPVLRIGWGSIAGFVPFPGGGEGWGGNGIGDDLYSYAFDGESLWTGEKKPHVYFHLFSPVIQCQDE